MKAIDVHGHFGPYDRGSGGLHDRLSSGGIDLVRQRAQAVDICLTVVSAIHALIPYGGDVLRGNEDARQAAEQYSDICFWAVLDPQRSDTVRQAESLLRHPRCKGLKIHPREHGYEICEQGDRIFEFAVDHQAVILSHSGNRGCNPEDFVPFVNRYPEASLILGHLGNSEDDSLSRQVYALKRAEHGNLYVDTSSARSITSGLVEWAVSEVGAEHIVFGSDTPLYFAASQKARVEYAELTEQAKRTILFENAARLLKEPGAANSIG